MSWFLKVMAVGIVIGGGSAMVPISPLSGLLLYGAGGAIMFVWFEEKKV